MKKLYIKFIEGNNSSLQEAITKAKELGYRESIAYKATVFEGYGILELMKGGMYHTATKDILSLIKEGYTEVNQFEEGEEVEVRNTLDNNWKKRIYLTTIPGNIYKPFVCINTNDTNKYKTPIKCRTVNWSKARKIKVEHKESNLEKTFNAFLKELFKD